MIIKPNAEGVFYPSNKHQLLKLFDGYSKCNNKIKSRLIIVPHAGYEYSGALAYKTYHYLDKNIKNIIIIAPAIYNRIYGCITSDADAFKTPFGNIKINTAKKMEINNEAFWCESALTVQLPMIKSIFHYAVITPIIYGCEDYKIISKIIEENIEYSAIVIATNLSRFVPEREALKLDNQTAKKIFHKDIQDLDVELADGAVGVCGAIEFAQKYNYSFEQIGLTNSAKANNDTASVVGYGAWYLITQ